MLYPELFKTLERVRWSFDDIPWDRFDASLLSEEQAPNVNARIWGFLSMCLRGTAETMFKRT